MNIEYVMSEEIYKSHKEKYRLLFKGARVIHRGRKDNDGFKWLGRGKVGFCLSDTVSIRRKNIF